MKGKQQERRRIVKPAPHIAPIGLLSFLLLISPHPAHADVGDAMDFVSNSMSLAHLSWLLLMYVMIRKHSNGAQFIGLLAGGAVTAAICMGSFLFGFGAPLFMIAGFGAAVFLGACTSKAVARGWDARKEKDVKGEIA
jgi:hypothetical protein